MILTLVNSWFDEIADEFNERKDTTYKLRSRTALVAKPMNQQHLYYEISIRADKDYSLQDRRYWNVTGRIEITLQVTARTVQDFQRLFDMNIFGIERMIQEKPRYSNDSISQSLEIQRITSIAVTENQINEQGFCDAVIEFGMRVFDNSRQRTLTSTKTGT